MKWYGIVVFLVIIGGLAGIVYLGVNTEKIEFDFGEPTAISKISPTSSTSQSSSSQVTDDNEPPYPPTNMWGYDIDSSCDLAYFLQYHDYFNSFSGGHFDFSEYSFDGELEQQKLVKKIYAKYEKWEVDGGYVQKEMNQMRNNHINELETNYVLKHHDINPKFYSIVDKGVHYIESRNYDQDKREFSIFAHMVNPSLFGEDNSCEQTYLKYFGENTYDALKNYHGNNMKQVDAMWKEINSRVYG